jgi:hypothetical protein
MNGSVDACSRSGIEHFAPAALADFRTVGMYAQRSNVRANVAGRCRVETGTRHSTREGKEQP